ncbi:mercuric reductase, partial [Rhodanobacter sp. 115]
MGARVALIERAQIGGSRLNTGCVPSKALIRTSRLYAEMRDANHYGARAPDDIPPDFARAMERVRHVRAHLSGDDSVQRLIAAGVDVFFGDARFESADCLRIGEQALRFDKALIATG